MDACASVIVIGAGLGGLAAAAHLSRCGLDVTVLEAAVNAGGCAGTFYHQGYRFDAGATLAGGFSPGGPMERLAQAAGISGWAGRTADPVMTVHLPDGYCVSRYSDGRRHAEHRRAFGAASERFWRWQEARAEAMWDLALRLPDWPPQSLAQVAGVLRNGLAWLAVDPRRLSPGLLADAFRPAAAQLDGAPERLLRFVDAQLLISAQATSQTANALYAAAALDLPRRGVRHLEGGMGALADALVQAIRASGGRVLFRQEASRIVLQGGRPSAVETRKGDSYPAQVVIANLPPWNIANFLGEQAPGKLKRLPPRPSTGWGAFVVYAGIDEAIIPEGAALHQQVIAAGPLGEGNSVFLSISPVWDASRAPRGRRALTLSTHTALGPWWELYENDRGGYNRRKQAYTDRLLEAAGRAIPGLRDAADVVLPGTPVTFERYTRRAGGWVGGFPQESLFQAWGPRLAPGVWMVGDSIFPGQSTAAAALGGLRVARDVLKVFQPARDLRDRLAVIGSEQ